MSKTLLTLIALALATPACHELEAAAEKVPVQVHCPEPDLEAASDLVARFERDPEGTRKALTKQALSEPPAGALAVTCQLFDVQHLLLETGKRATEAYREATEGLKALGV